MAIIDEKGRILGRLNLLDGFVVLMVCALVVWGFLAIMAPQRVASPYPLRSNEQWVRVDLRLPPERAWMGEHIAKGQRHLDARSGNTQVEVLGVASTETDEGLVVTLRLLAVSDHEGRLVYDGKNLVPGLELRIETEANVIEGRVSRVESES